LLFNSVVVAGSLNFDSCTGAKSTSLNKSTSITVRPANVAKRRINCDSLGSLIFISRINPFKNLFQFNLNKHKLSQKLEYKMTHAQLAQEIYKICHLNGNFNLRSGQISHEYFDKYRFESQPHLLRNIAEKMKSLIPENTEVLAALEMGGIPIGTALSLATGIPCAFIRKEAKSYGTCQFAEGLDLQNKHVCIIEDVITSGGQVLLSATDLRNIGAHVNSVLCVINRGGSEAELKLKKSNLDMKSLFVRSDFP
jgi:orotate phosphoribosyltransferase